MKPHLVDGWLVVPYSGPELAVIEIGVQVGAYDPVWEPAFLDWEEGRRIAKVRRSVGLGPQLTNVLVRVNGSERMIAKHVTS